MHFASDNWAGCLPEVLEAVSRAMQGAMNGYGGDPYSQATTRRLSEIFERDVAVFYAATGTAANALALAALAGEGDVILAHPNAHIITSECGAVEFFSRARIRPIGLDKESADDGRISPARLGAELAALSPPTLHYGRAGVLSLTEASESGTVYSAAAIAELGAIARAHGLKIHMDGARFANAVVATGASPADLTWKAGVDILSFGATKNGALLAEALVVFDPALVERLRYLHKRSGNLFSKSRLIGAQFEAYLDNDLWLRAAANANAMAARLAAGLAKAGLRFGWPVEANELFPILPDKAIGRLRAEGAVFYDWEAGALPAGALPGPGETAVRLVTSFATSSAEVDAFIAQVAACLA